MARVRIVKKPTAKTGLEVKMQPGLYGTNGNRQFSLPTQIDSQKYSEPDTEVRNTLQPVPRNMANLEAEKGETAVVNIDGFPAHFNIGGKRHSQGGTPLNLPDDSFIFSDTTKMKIKDPEILKQFGMSLKSGGYTPADIAKKYQINKFRKMLADPETDDLQRSTAEMMIANYNEKLAKLAIAQESKKGFPQGLPAIAQPYLQAHNIDPAQYMPTQGQQDDPNADMGVARYGANVVSNWHQAYGGVQYHDGLPMGQHGFDPTSLKGWGAGLLNVLEAPQRAMMYVGTGLFGDKARYEMPSETLKRNYPQSSPYLQGALDIVADPFLVAGALKSGARLATKAITEAATEQAIKGTLKNASKYEATRVILSAAGKPVTAKNLAIATKAAEAAKASVDAGKKIHQVQKATAKAAATERMVQDAGKIAEAAKTAGKTVVEKAGQAGKYVAEKAKKVADVIDSPYMAPAVKPLVRTTTSTIMGKGYQQEAEEAKKQLLAAQQQLEQQAKTSKYVPAGSDKTGIGMFSNPAYPGKTFMYANGKYVPYQPTVQEAAKDTLKGLTDAEINKMMGFAYGGSYQSGGAYQKGGVTNKDGKYYFTTPDGKVVPISKQQADAYAAKQAGRVGMPSMDHFGSGKEQSDIKVQKKAAGLPRGANTRKIVGRTATGEAIYDYGTRTKPPYDIKQAFDKSGIERLNMMRQQYGLPAIEPGNPSDPTYQAKVKAAAGEMQQAGITQNPELVYDYMRTKNPKPNAKLEQLLQSKGYGKTNADLQKAITEGKLTPDEVRNAYKDDQWWFRGVTTQKKTLPREEYEKKMKQEGLIKQGDKSFFAEDPDQPWLYTEYDPYDPEKPAPKVTIKPGEKEPDVKREDFPKANLQPVKGNTNAPWWLQDIIGTAGAWGDMARVKKYQPWQATPQTFLPQATFYDPTRELAANAEQANIASQFHQAFTGPKSGQISQSQGQALENAANIMGRYNNMNVGVANQLEQERAQIMNQASQNRAGLATQLWDKNTIANQQFDNAKAQAREQLRKHVISAVTNRAKTQALNSLYPNYYTDPSTGGMLGFHPDFSKIPAAHPDFSNPYLEAMKLTRDPDRALRYLELQNKGAMSNPYDERKGYMGAQGYGE